MNRSDIKVGTGSKIWGMMTGVVAVCLFGSVQPASAAEPVKPTIFASPAVVVVEPGKIGSTTLVYNAGPKHPRVEVWFSVNGGALKKLLEDEGDGKGVRKVSVPGNVAGSKIRYVLTDFGKVLASVDVIAKRAGSAPPVVVQPPAAPTSPPVVVTPPATPTSAADAFRNAIVSYAAERVGQTFSERSTLLVDQALEAAGAKPRKKNVWGTVYTSGALKPGDIIHFEDAQFKDGKKLGSFLHAAIVESAFGTSVTILHVDPSFSKAIVSRLKFDLRELKSGNPKFYHPLPK